MVTTPTGNLREQTWVLTGGQSCSLPCSRSSCQPLGCAGLGLGRSGRIDHVADGDTVDLTNGAKLRLVQIETPEVYLHPPECYGKRASAVTKRLLPPGTLVRLTGEPATARSTATAACSAT